MSTQPAITAPEIFNNLLVKKRLTAYIKKDDSGVLSIPLHLSITVVRMAFPNIFNGQNDHYLLWINQGNIYCCKENPLVHGAIDGNNVTIDKELMPLALRQLAETHRDFISNLNTSAHYVVQPDEQDKGFNSGVIQGLNMALMMTKRYSNADVFALEKDILEEIAIQEQQDD